MKKRIKILYLMNVDWSWIRQRPHILAQKLDESYDLKVLFPQYLTRPWRKQKTTLKTRDCHGIFQIPGSRRISELQKLQHHLNEKMMGDLSEYDLIWLTTPIYIDYVPLDYKGIIIYDDMDDIVSIQTNSVTARQMQLCQEKLFQRADRIFVTSQYLLDALAENIRGKAVLVRNGAFYSQINAIHEPDWKRSQFSLGYIGTISEWFDFSVVIRCLKQYSNIRFDLFGPDMVAIPHMQRLCHHGIIEHEKLAETIRHVDCMIMPFALNKITLAVDPVKLYEYISFGKCIISVWYPEIERFAPFVYFYQSEEEFVELVRKLMDLGFPPKYDAEMQREFLTSNCWEHRVREVEMEIEKLLEGRRE